MKILHICMGARDGAVGWCTALQAGRSWVWFPMVSMEIFHWHNHSGSTMALGLTQPLTEMSTRNISWVVKAAGTYSRQPYHLHVPIVLKSVNLNLLEPSWPVQVCNGIALHFKYSFFFLRNSNLRPLGVKQRPHGESLVNWEIFNYCSRRCDTILQVDIQANLMHPSSGSVYSEGRKIRYLRNVCTHLPH